MAKTHPAQDPVPIEYESKEGHRYSEVHGDADHNITVESKAEREGAVQPNLEGTTPDPFHPELTEFEKQRRGLTEDRGLTASGEPAKSEEVRQSEEEHQRQTQPQEEQQTQKGRQAGGNKMAAPPANK